ncbi:MULTISPECIES: hypothetical protein [unclassified Nocardioides]|uniref:hypothetical protein n=1 Tax=unclassified Nocardioides TaxID=2615069 RepID=UPI000AE9D160|nr:MULTISPECIES: hypothetical protein [unclassified Nocardioides]
MKDKQRERVSEIVGPMLDAGETVEAMAQAIVKSAPAEQGRVGGAARRLNKAVNARSAARAEGFVVVTDRRIICLGKSAAMRPTGEVVAQLGRSDIDHADYKRGVTSTLTLWPQEGDGLEFTFGLILRSSADELARVLGATS